MKRSYGAVSGPPKLKRQYATSARSRKSRAGRPFRQGPQAGSTMVRLTRQPGFPSKMLMRHKYTDALNVNNATGALIKTPIASNGMFSVIAGGHQPSYFDTMCSIYNHYTVIGAILKITVDNSNPASVIPCLVCVQQNDDNAITAFTSIATMNEQPNSQIIKVPNGVGGPNKTIVQKYSAKGTFGSGVMANDNLQGTSAANPTEGSYWIVGTQSADASASQYIVNLLVEIEYLAVWEELKDIAQS